MNRVDQFLEELSNAEPTRPLDILLMEAVGIIKAQQDAMDRLIEASRNSRDD